MKESISIIFAALLGVFLIVLLPLFSLLDRQDSIAYNVVLTETTKFVDKVRTNGFIDGDSYTEYISAISSTGNTYKVTIQAYKKLIIKETDSRGKEIPDSFVEEKELYNTKDIMKAIGTETTEEIVKAIGEDSAEKTVNSTKKNSAFLFKEDDEIYIKVENTNITTGSLIYSMLANTNNAKVVDINYGGTINNINWELYDKIESQTIDVPQVLMSVPVNAKNNTNIKIVDNTGTSEFIDCTIENLEEAIDVDLEKLCADLVAQEGQNYTYLYDLAQGDNSKIRVAVELRKIDKIDIGTIDEDEDAYVPISELKEEYFNEESTGGVQSEIEKYIIDSYIRTYGMYALSIDMDLRKSDKNYVFDITFNDVIMTNLDYISTKASIVILPGLGQDENGTLSLGAESVEIEILDKETVNTVTMSVPHIWEKLLKTKSSEESRISTNTVYAGVDLAFILSYTGINHTPEEIKEALESNLRIYADDRKIDGLVIYTADELSEEFGINLATLEAGHMIIKFRYTDDNSTKENYVQVLDNWITTNISQEEAILAGYQYREEALGATSQTYEVLSDTSAPLAPGIVLSGTIGSNGWYTSEVTLTIDQSKNDTVIKNGEIVVGGSGVAKHTLELKDATVQEEKETKSVILTANGTTKAIAKAYDYLENVSKYETEIKIDTEFPTEPSLEILTSKDENVNWYNSDVEIKIVPGKDNVSGIQKTTLRIESENEANKVAETEVQKDKIYTLDKNGYNTVYVTTYDNAGNSTTKEYIINIDKALAPEANIEVTGGSKREGSDWYYTDEVEVSITITRGDAISGLGKAEYEIVGKTPTTQLQEGTTTITLTENGFSKIIVHTYTGAMKVTTTYYDVYIDNESPNTPTVNLSGTQGDGEWYTSDAVTVEVIPNGDVGSGVRQVSYKINNGIEKDITNISKEISITDEGENTLKVYIRDMAFNEVSVEKTIKIDKTNPTGAEFVVEGTMKDASSGWYTSGVNISYKGASDSVSGIASVTLSKTSVEDNTNGEQITLVTKDNAGHTVTKTQTIKIDKTAPIAPEIIVEGEQVNNEGPLGVKLFNGGVKLIISPKGDYLIDGVDNTKNTNYVIKDNDDNIVEEGNITESEEILLNEDGRYNITVTTWDKAGNSTSTTENIWINKQKPATPVIEKINGENVRGLSEKEITSNSETINLELSNIEDGNEVTIKLINQSSHKVEEIKTEYKSQSLQVNIATEGTYLIVVSQKNMHGITSDENEGLYYYNYIK